jgi:hypothetical protein
MVTGLLEKWETAKRRATVRLSCPFMDGFSWMPSWESHTRFTILKNSSWLR